MANLRPLTSSLRGLRICFIAGTLGQGGAERQLFYMLQILQEAGACVRVLSLSQGELWESPIRGLGVEVSNVGESASRLNRLLNIVREVRHFKPEIVQAQHFYVNLYAAVAARISGCREIGAIRSNVTSEVADMGGWFRRASFRWPRMLACNSRAAVRCLVDLGVPNKRLFFLPNVIDTAHFASGSAGRPSDTLRFGTNGTPAERTANCLNLQHSASTQCPTQFQASSTINGFRIETIHAPHEPTGSFFVSQGAEPEISTGLSHHGDVLDTPDSSRRLLQSTEAVPNADFVILGIGRLVAVKRFDLFLQALAQLNSKIPVRGIIAGDGPLRGELEAQAGRLGLLSGTVEFSGRLNDPVELYRRANLFLLTSDHEGTPNVILEAMASGVPIVATRVGDVPDLLGNGERGRLVAPSNLRDLVSAIEDLQGDPESRICFATHALDFVQAQHSHNSLREHLTKLYSQTIAA